MSTQFARTYSSTDREAIVAAQEQVMADMRALYRKVSTSFLGSRPMPTPVFKDAILRVLILNTYPLWLAAYARALHLTNRTRRFADVIDDTPTDDPVVLDPYDPIESIIIDVAARRATPGRPRDLIDRAIESLGDMYDPIAQVVTENMRTRLQDVLTEGFNQGKGRDRIMDDIHAELEHISMVSARRIAQTETVRAYSNGALVQYASNVLIQYKEWIAAPDACPLCDSLNGQMQLIDDPFTSEDGDTFDGPPAHPNCRCAVGGSMVGPENAQVEA